jgi:hypothetical protein
MRLFSLRFDFILFPRMATLFPLRATSSVVEQWLQRGGDVNAPFPSEQWAPLHVACAEGDVALARLLLDRGAKPGWKGSSTVLLQQSPLHVAARFGRATVVQLLLERGAVVSDQDAHGMTPLHYAAFHGHEEVCELLIGSGAVPDTTSLAGMTALEAAEAGTGGPGLVTRLADEAERSKSRLPLLDWLRSLGCSEYGSRFIAGGYDDIGFIASHGLTVEDLDCVGIPTSKLGARKKLMALHNITAFLQEEAQSDSGEDEGEEESDVSSEGEEEEEEEESQQGDSDSEESDD